MHIQRGVVSVLDCYRYLWMYQFALIYVIRYCSSLDLNDSEWILLRPSLVITHELEDIILTCIYQEHLF